jgi:hypothetical protein
MNKSFLLYVLSDFGTIEKHVLSSNFQNLTDEAYIILARSVKFLKKNESFTARIYSTGDLKFRSRNIPILWECYYSERMNSGQLVRPTPDAVLPEELAILTAEVIENYLV